MSQQELVEVSDIALNHYNETHPVGKISKGVSKAVYTVVKIY